MCFYQVIPSGKSSELKRCNTGDNLALPACNSREHCEEQLSAFVELHPYTITQTAGTGPCCVPAGTVYNSSSWTPPALTVWEASQHQRIRPGFPWVKGLPARRGQGAELFSASAHLWVSPWTPSILHSFCVLCSQILPQGGRSTSS